MTILVLILIAVALFAIVGHSRDRNVLEAARLELEASRLVGVEQGGEAVYVDSGEQREALLRVVSSAREVVEAMPEIAAEVTASRLEELVAAQPDICRQLNLEQRQVLARADYVHTRLERFIAADRARPGWEGPSGDPSHPGWLEWRTAEALRRYPHLGSEKVGPALNYFVAAAKIVSRCPPEAMDLSDRYINLMLANQPSEVAMLFTRDERAILVRADYAIDKLPDA